MAEERLNTPGTTIWAIPIAGVANVTALTVAEINAGTNISCAIEDGYALNPIDSDVDDSRTICDDGNVDNMTDENYEVNLTLFWDANLANTLSVFNIAMALFQVPAEFIFVKRVSKKKSTQVAAAGDIVSWFGAENDWPQITDVKGTPKKLVVPGIPNGIMKLRQTLA